jgi:hypothetical protein
MGKLCEFLVLTIFCAHSSMQDFFSKLLKLYINIDNECCCIGIYKSYKASALQQHNSNALCVHVFGCAIYLNPHCAAGAYDA